MVDVLGIDVVKNFGLVDGAVVGADRAQIFLILGVRPDLQKGLQRSVRGGLYINCGLWSPGGLR